MEFAVKSTLASPTRHFSPHTNVVAPPFRLIVARRRLFLLLPPASLNLTTTSSSQFAPLHTDLFFGSRRSPLTATSGLSQLPLYIVVEVVVVRRSPPVIAAASPVTHPRLLIADLSLKRVSSSSVAQVES
ncbi:hypothetical protein C2S51_032439 [Perilla frutescens var. frutescens]|nr:hypothetical protein C2S51_032439 [Perilla frutescens var. frutescens]